MGHPLVVSEVNAGHSVLAGTLSFKAQCLAGPTVAHLATTWIFPFGDALPIRRPAAFKGQHNFADLWWCASRQRPVGFESWYKRLELMRLDFDPDVTGVASQPFRIFLPGSLPQKSHVPEYFVRRADEEVFRATAALCASMGWGYQ